MTAKLRRCLRGLVAYGRRRPDEVLRFFALSVAIYVLAAPLAAAHYPPLTDLPFHAAQTSMLRHYWDPSFHFKEQFELHPMAVPYLGSYVVGALFMLVFSAVTATKLAVFVMLGLLPAGLAVMAWGMRKSPLLGFPGLILAWGNLTHWGFINFVGAIGLFAMAVGLALRLLDHPSRGLQVGLGAALVALFFTHVFRFPFAVLAILGAGVLLYPATRRFRVLLLPIVPSLVLFAVWYRVRPPALQNDSFPIALHFERIYEIPTLLAGAFHDPAEMRWSMLAGSTVAGVGLACLALAIAEKRFSALSKTDRRFALGATAVAICCTLGFFALFLVLPMEMGIWWYVYPREATAFVALLFAVIPNLPKSPRFRAFLVIAMAATTLRYNRVIVDNDRIFDQATKDFETISAELPQAPKLLYLVYDHSGSTRNTTPFIHLPAYVQAEKGGWLSFHFVNFGASPFTYRPADYPGAVVAPSFGVHRWEWRPEVFNVLTHGPFFDWFLVRSPISPDGKFSRDPTIERVDHVGTWWLYKRKER